MNVLIVHNHYRLRGGEDVCFESDTKMLRDRGHKVVHYTRHNDDVGSRSRWRELRETLWNPTSYSEVSSLIERESIDLLHVHNTFPLISPSIYDAAHDLGIPVVQSLHNFRPLCVGAALCRDGKFCTKCLTEKSGLSGIRNRCYRGSLAASSVSALLNRRNRRKRLWQRIDRYITFCQRAKDLYSEAGFPQQRIELNPHYVEQECEVASNRDNAFIFVGRLTIEKGLDRLLEAWSRYTGNWELRIVGEGPMEREAQAAAERDPRIRLLGKIPRAEMMQWMATSSCLIFPSPAFETFGRVLIEAYSLGIPVIASNLGGPADIVISDDHGLLIDPLNTQQMADAIEKMTAMIERKFPQMRQACRERYLNHYTQDLNYNRLIDIYSQAIEFRAGRKTRKVLA